MGRTRTEKVIRNSSAGMVSRILVIFLDFIVKTIFINQLGVQYNGVQGLFTSILTALSLAELGIGSAIAFNLYKPISDKNYKEIAKYMNFYKKAYRLVALFIFVVGVALIPALPYLVKDVPDIKENIIIIYLLYIVNSASSYLLIYKSVLLTANQNGYKMSIIEIIFNILKYGFQCASLLIFRDFITFLVIGIVFTILKNVVTSIVARKDFKEIKEYKNEKLSKEELKKIMTDVGALAMYTAVGTVLKSTDNIIVSAVLGTTMVGYLSNYALIKKSIQLILNQFYHSVTPSIGNMKAEGENERQYDIFRKYNFTVFWITCFACTSFITLFTPFVRDIWLDSRFVLPMSIVLALVLDFFMANMTSVMSSFRNANGLFIQGKWRPLIMAIINVVLSIILAKPWGMFGVLIATSISRAVTQLWYDPILIFKKVFNRNAKEYFVRYAIYLFITAISSGITYHISKIISISNVYLNFIVLVLLCIAIPNILNTIIWCRTEDFKGIKKAGNKLLKKIKK